MEGQERTFTQEEVNDIVGKRLLREREKAEAEFQAKANSSAAEAEATRLKAEKQWETLAANAEARVRTLEPLEAQVKAYAELISGMLKDRVKALGDTAKKAVAGLPESMSALEKLDWLSKNEALFQDTGTFTVGTPAGRKSHRKDKSVRPDGYRPKRL